MRNNFNFYFILRGCGLSGSNPLGCSMDISFVNMGS